MQQTTKTLTILFADISGSTTLYESLGNETAHQIVEECLSRLSNIVISCTGEIIKAMGDGIMCSFKNAQDAASACIQMNQAIDGLTFSFPEMHSAPNIRTGFHTGTIIIDGNDIFGDAVNVAARMVSLAKPRQIITTSMTAETLPEHLKGKTRFVDRTTIKGKSGEFDIYEIIWEEGNQTVVMSAEHHDDGFECLMNLECSGKSASIGSQKPSITIGRQEHNDLTIDDTLVSRTHCRIEYHKGKFIFTDCSSNGSYIHNEGGYTVFIHNDESVLGDKGFISLGHDRTDNSALLIQYSIKRH
jgi:class 3 adenylate cyclase